MDNGLEALTQAYNVLFTAVLILLALLVMLCLMRAVKGPKTADRVVSVNMMGTMVIVIIAVLSIMLGEGYLVDICIIYALISFLAVIVLTKVYMGVYREKAEESVAAGQAVEAEKAAVGQTAEEESVAAGQAAEAESAAVERMAEEESVAAGQAVEAEKAAAGQGGAR